MSPEKQIAIALYFTHYLLQCCTVYKSKWYEWYVILFNHTRFNSQSSYSFICKLSYEENSLFSCKTWQMS